MGLAASLKHQDAGLIPSTAQWVKMIWCVGHNYGSELIPGPGTPCAVGQPKTKRKKKKKKKRIRLNLMDKRTSHLKKILIPAAVALKTLCVIIPM